MKNKIDTSFIDDHYTPEELSGITNKFEATLKIASDLRVKNGRCTEANSPWQLYLKDKNKNENS